jgi:hypothetical protein
MGKAIKSMTLAEAKSYREELMDQGKELSTSKELGKVENYIKTLQPEKYGTETVASAYKQLSSGVTTPGGWTEANLDKIEEYTGTRPQLSYPTSADGLPSYLSGYQNSLYGAAGSPALRESIMKQLEPDMDKPELLNRVKEYENLREEYGVADIEKSVTDLKAQLEAQYAQKRERVSAMEGGQVPMNVIAGRVGEVERQETFRIDAINRQLSTLVDQLNSSYAVISNYMNYMGLDYQDAVNAYNTEFNRNLQVYNLVQESIDKQTAAARANLQMFANSITSGNMSYSSLSSDQKLFVNKLELQSGLPVGFVSNLKLSAKDKLLNVNSETGEALIMNADGTFNVVKTGMTPTGGSSSTNALNTALEKGRNDLEAGYSWGSVWNRIHQQFPNATTDQIDNGLGTEWREGGAYEAYRSKTGTTSTSASTQSEIAEVKQVIIANGGTAEDLKRAETDPNFRAYILATY